MCLLLFSNASGYLSRIDYMHFFQLAIKVLNNAFWFISSIGEGVYTLALDGKSISQFYM